MFLYRPWLFQNLLNFNFQNTSETLAVFIRQFGLTKICLYKYGAYPSIKSCMKQYLIFICNYHSMKCRNKQSCQVQPKSMSQSWEQAANSRFSFYRKLHKDIFDFLIDAWWYLWTNCSEVILTFIKFQTPHQEFTIQSLYALLWCMLHCSTSSQLGTKLIFRK